MDEQKPQEDTEEIVQEGEVVAADLAPAEASDSSATVLESLESLIRENLARIDKLGQEANKHKEMIDSVLTNDETYRQHEEAAKAAAKVKNATKQEILKRPDVSHIDAKYKEVTAEIKEIKESMNSYLQEYRRLSGSDEIETDSGAMQIVYKAVLVKRKS